MLNLEKILKDMAHEKLESRAREMGVSIEEAQRVIDIEEEEHRRKSVLLEARRREEREATIANEAAKRKALGNKLGFGVAVYVAHIINIGGLTVNSNCSGMTRSTVFHLVFDDDYRSGRLTRKAGDLLCKPASKLGARTFNVQGHDSWDGEVKSLTEREVTCKACLARLSAMNSTGSSQSMMGSDAESNSKES